MAPVNQLTPGDIVTLSGFAPATFITRTTHPLWPHLELVIWRDPNGEWHHDALMATQEVGHVQPATPDDRRRALRAALTPDAFPQEPT
jgi:hypothetical protein